VYSYLIISSAFPVAACHIGNTFLAPLSANDPLNPSAITPVRASVKRRRRGDMTWTHRRASTPARTKWCYDLHDRADQATQEPLNLTDIISTRPDLSVTKSTHPEREVQRQSKAGEVNAVERPPFLVTSMCFAWSTGPMIIENLITWVS